MAAIIGSIALGAIQKGLETTIGGIVARANAATKSKLKTWQSKKAITAASAKLDQVRYVKTIWQIDKSVDLFDFYHPSKVETGNARTQVNCLEDIPCDGNVIIQGIVGQGKSIFLRYLTCVEVVDGKVLPLFIELRRLQPGEKLLDHIIAELKALGLNADEVVFSNLAAEGLITLLLDAFDEVREADRSRLIVELEKLLRTHCALRIVVTSRPASGIENSPAFHVIKLSELRNAEYEAVIRRTCHDQQSADAIVEGLRERGAAIRGLLITPLMVALLVFRYRADHSIPESYPAFFSALFPLLLQRHDKAKAGYARERKSKLGDDDLETTFCTICFLTRKQNETAFNRGGIFETTRTALKIADLKSAPELVVDDVCGITCLILEEGGEYRFIHKIVQEYHAACFVARQPDEAALRFYSAMPKLVSMWEQELRFLETLDVYRCTKYFIVPMLEKFLSDDASKSKSAISDWLSFSSHRMGKQKKSAITISLNLDADDHWYFNRAMRPSSALGPLNALRHSLVLPESRKSYSARELINAGIAAEQVRAVVAGFVDSLIRDLERAKRAVSVLESHKELMSF